VGAFVAEFLKRKDAEVLRIQQAAKKKGAKKERKKILQRPKINPQKVNHPLTSLQGF
jgi:hypothetical protein